MFIFRLCSILFLMLLFYSISAQTDSVNFAFVPVNSKVKYEIKEVSKGDLPNKIVVLSCLLDTLGVIEEKGENVSMETFILMIESKELFEFNSGLKYSCEFKYGNRHGSHKEYYEYEVLKNVCIKSNPFLKISGKWKRGMKHGFWTYYNTNGSVQRIEKYRRDKKLKTWTL